MKNLIKSIALPLIVGVIAGLIMMPFNNYSSLNQPPFAPPAIAFPIAWTILYILMGISSYIIKKNQGSLTLYYFQLFFNFFWTIIFFVFKLRLIAFIWLLILLFLVILMVIRFYKINKTAAYLQIPYIIWLVFAGYLNLGTYLLN